MRADAFFAAVDALPFEPLSSIIRGGGLVIVAPHPDDESLGCAGLIREACRQSVAVRLVVVTDGVGSHPKSRRYPPVMLRDLRVAETKAAVAALGLPESAIRFLDLPDRSVPTEGPEAEKARDAIIAAVAEVAAGAVCVTWRRDPHCDHAASAALVEAALMRCVRVRVLSYPVWGWTLPPETEVGEPPSGLRFDITPHLAAKASAIAAHRSQVTNLIDDDPDGFRLSDAMLARFARPYEIFLDAGATR